MMSPIIIFAFNRIESLKATVGSLLLNPEAKDSDLYVFVDGPRKEKPQEAGQVERVREYVAAIAGFKSLTVRCSEENKGLGASIIGGVTGVMKKHGRAIVLEDDLYLQPNFLAYMNKALDEYAGCKEVFSVCGYSNKVHVPDGYCHDAYFCTRSSSWGWATWSDRWESVDWELRDWDGYMSRATGFNRWGGSDCLKMLREWHEGRNKSWAIRFCFAQYLQDKLSLFPVKSLVRNDGFDGTGTNCKGWSRFRYELMQPVKREFALPADISMDRRLYKQALWYHSIPLRIWSRLMYLIH